MEEKRAMKEIGVCINGTTESKTFPDLNANSTKDVIKTESITGSTPVSDSEHVTCPNDMLISIDSQKAVTTENVSEISNQSAMEEKTGSEHSFGGKGVRSLSKRLSRSLDFNQKSLDFDTSQDYIVPFMEQRCALKNKTSDFQIHNQNNSSVISSRGSPRILRSAKTVPQLSPRHQCSLARHVSTPNLSVIKPSKVRFAVPIVTNSSRYFCRRNALCDPEKMIMSQDTREKIQSDVARRKSSLTRKISNFLITRLGLERDEDLL